MAVASRASIDHFHKCRRICNFFVFTGMLSRTYRPHFGLNILLNFAHGSEVRKAY